MCAVENERQQIVEILLENGAHINFQSRSGWTALHQAVDLSIDGTIQTRGKLGEEPTEMIQYLLNKGAEVDIEDISGRSPLDIAMSYKSSKITNLLQEYEPKEN